MRRKHSSMPNSLTLRRQSLPFSDTGEILRSEGWPCKHTTTKWSLRLQDSQNIYERIDDSLFVYVKKSSRKVSRTYTERINPIHYTEVSDYGILSAPHGNHAELSLSAKLKNVTRTKPNQTLKKALNT